MHKGTRETTPGRFNCNTGTWEYMVAEDRNFMELTCAGAQVSFIQIMNCSEHQMEFIPGTGKLPLRFEKVR
ncbi:MAG TPA: hypothetical protein VK177_04385 [Flavobacteriales bacterium]|nr:hypothetical protein [Flavobacteriales bacterium]